MKTLKRGANKNWGILRLIIRAVPVIPVINPPEFWGARAIVIGDGRLVATGTEI